MFVSIIHNGVLTWEPGTYKCRYGHTLVDTEFEQQLVTKSLASHPSKTALIIKAYKERGLDVPINIVLYILSLVKFFGYTPRGAMSNIEAMVGEYAEYKEEVERYMELM